MQVDTLLAALPTAAVIGETTRDVTGISYDSRTVMPNTMFVAIRGTHVDGHRFVAQAIMAGATTIVYDDEGAIKPLGTAQHPNITWIKVPNSRAALAPLAAAFYGYPARKLRVVGVTGTKGKTTTSTLCAHVLDCGGHRSGMVGTANVKIGVQWSDNTTRQTTPEGLEIQQLLQAMVVAGCDHAVIEASSHALSQRWNRVGDCAFDVAVFTNVTHEHLDYHGTVEQYRRDKARLFELLHAELPGDDLPGVDKRHKVAIINLDDPHADLYLQAAGPNVDHLTYAIEHPSAHVRAIDVDLRSDGTTYTAWTPWGEVDVDLQLPGHFNVLNSLAGLCVGLAEGIALDECASALGAVKGVTGRMERIDVGQPFTVIVDYAHNPSSFEEVMSMMRPLTHGQLISVFGSAGERDVEKRSLQGEIAGRYCDLVIISDEDPRDEDREAILEAIAVGVRQAGKQEARDYLKIADREAALRTAFQHAKPGDIVLLLGKGHESSIIYEGGRKLPWMERAVAERILREMGYP